MLRFRSKVPPVLMYSEVGLRTGSWGCFTHHGVVRCWFRAGCAVRGRTWVEQVVTGGWPSRVTCTRFLTQASSFFFCFCPPWEEELSSSKSFYHVISALRPANHGLSPMKCRAKVNSFQSSCRVVSSSNQQVTKTMSFPYLTRVWASHYIYA